MRSAFFTRVFLRTLDSEASLSRSSAEALLVASEPRTKISHILFWFIKSAGLAKRLSDETASAKHLSSAHNITKQETKKPQ